MPTIKDSLSAIGTTIKDEVDKHGGAKNLGKEIVDDVQKQGERAALKTTEAIASLKKRHQEKIHDDDNDPAIKDDIIDELKKKISVRDDIIKELEKQLTKNK